MSYLVGVQGKPTQTNKEGFEKNKQKFVQEFNNNNNNNNNNNSIIVY
jgi:hypothetical protein